VSKAAMHIVMAMLAVGLALGMGLAKEPPKETQAAVEAEVAAGLKAFKAGKIHDAIARLQKAISLMQDLVAGDLAAYFPKAPEGWQAGEISKESIAAAGTTASSFIQVTRTYVRTKDKLRVEIRLTNSPQLLAAQQAAAKAFENPMVLRMLNQDPNKQIKRIDRDGWVGWSVVEKGRKAEATAFTKTCLLFLGASKADADALEMFLKAIDLKNLSKALGAAAGP